jgi:PPK2 family polyphosphate:nucleotide phosphotransferase
MDKKSLKQMVQFINPYRVNRGKGFRLKDIDPRDTGGLQSGLKDEATAWLQQGVEMLAEEQNKLYAQNKWAVLLIFQAMDAAGKDGTIKHVMSGVNPQGCHVTSFKAPTSTELDHDYLWRSSVALPERGRIGIFNRSYYEEVLVVRVHPPILAGQQIPPELNTKKIWQQRFDDINAHEKYLSRNGVAIRKFFLHVSKAEQRRRFIERLEAPEKNWKFSPRDVKEREHWDDYMNAYEEMIRATATEHAPWFVVPADNKWFTRLVVSASIVDLMEGLNLRYPKIDATQMAALRQARAVLVAEKSKRRVT